MKAKILALVCVVALVAAACGGGGDDDDTTAESTDEPTEEPTDEATEEPTDEATEEPTDEATEEPTDEATEEPTEEVADESGGPFYWELFEVGTCFDDPPDYDEVVEPVNYAEVHGNEIYAMADYASDSDEFPGEDELFQSAQAEVCGPAYETFMGVSISTEVVLSFAIVPDADTWARGDRRLVCGVFDEFGLIGTAASAGLQAPGLRVLHVSNFEEQVDLYISAQGGDPDPVTFDPEEEVINPPGLGPDGRVVYARYPLGDTTEADIFAIEPDAGITALLATSDDEAAPQLSPDGSKIVYHSAQGSEEYDIWVMDADGSNPTRLTTNPDRDGTPSWSPDGSQIVYRARHDDVSNIWITNTDGSEPRQLTDDPGGDYDPVFSPDGTRIAFSSDRAGNFDVWVMNADGSEPVNLTNHPAADEYPSWTADGAGIAFTSDRAGTLIWIMTADGSDQTLFTLAGPSGYGTAAGPMG